MQSLNLNQSTKSLLTATILIADPNKPGSEIFSAFPCGIDGKALAPGASPIPVYKDLYTGTVFARVAERIPKVIDSETAEVAQTLLALKPIHYSSDEGSVVGWFIEAPNFDASAKVAS
jgi:hypothetical protein